MASANGRLPDESLAAIPGGRLEKTAAASWNRMRKHIAAKTGIWIAPTSSRTAYRTYAEQVYFWNLYQKGQGSLAAVPGTSNHGWGLAVDVPTTAMANAINRYGAEFGWQKKWSDAPTEWWHFRYAVENDKHRGEPVKRRTHPIHFLTPRERYYRDLLVMLRRKAHAAGEWSGNDLVRAQAAKRRIAQLIVVIQNAVDTDVASGTVRATAWKKKHRRERVAYLRKIIGT